MPYASREDELAHKKAEYAKNPEKFKRRAKDRRARMTPEARAFERFCGKRKIRAAAARDLLLRKTHCAFCGGCGELHVDHIVPTSRGGLNVLENLQWLCPTCNAAKGALTRQEFLSHIDKILRFLET
jgi:5-methylcytosine-specific restriction endonuclease McrA